MNRFPTFKAAARPISLLAVSQRLSEPPSCSTEAQAGRALETCSGVGRAKGVTMYHTKKRAAFLVALDFIVLLGLLMLLGIGLFFRWLWPWHREKRRQLVFASYADADMMLRSSGGWRLAPEEDSNPHDSGVVWLERDL